MVVTRLLISPITLLAGIGLDIAIIPVSMVTRALFNAVIDQSKTALNVQA